MLLTKPKLSSRLEFLQSAASAGTGYGQITARAADTKDKPQQEQLVGVSDEYVSNEKQYDPAAAVAIDSIGIQTPQPHPDDDDEFEIDFNTPSVRKDFSTALVSSINTNGFDQAVKRVGEVTTTNDIGHKETIEVNHDSAEGTIEEDEIGYEDEGEGLLARVNEDAPLSQESPARESLDIQHPLDNHDILTRTGSVSSATVEGDVSQEATGMTLQINPSIECFC